MNRQLELQAILKNIVGSNNVYYQKPPNTQVSYPYVKYDKQDIHTVKANNNLYNSIDMYQLVLVGTNPDDQIKYRLLRLPYCSYDRQYKADNLYHDVFTLYF